MLVLSTREFVQEPFKSRITIPCSSMVFLVLIPINFPNQTFWGLIFPVPAPRVRVPDVGHNPFTPWVRVLYFGDPSWLWGHHIWGGVPGEAVCLPLLPFSMCLFCLLLWRCCLSSSQVLFRGKTVLHVAVNMLCLWEEVSSRSSYTTSLDSLFLLHLF